MKLKSRFLLWGMLLIVISLFSTLQGCKKSEGELGTSASGAKITVSPVAGRANTYALKGAAQNAYRYQWDRGDGSLISKGLDDTVYFFKKGTYKVKFYAHGRGGFSVDSSSIVVPTDDQSGFPLNNPTFQLLISKTWKLDPNPSAAAIIVGPEWNPGEYYAGGPLDASQIDDEYTFAATSPTTFSLNYDAKANTFNGGNIAPNYSVGPPRSFTAPFTFSTTITPAGGAGIATITLPSATPPTVFIGVTDVSGNTYRILSITATTLVLRGGSGLDPTFTFKFIAK
jgi:hypothetical protein